MSEGALAYQRLRLDLAYDGTNFHGWARQPGLRTVEGVATAALALVLQRPVQLTVAGRTDAGVHARSQVAHVDLEQSEWGRADAAGLVRRVQSLISRDRGEAGGPDLVLKKLTPVSSDFDARFSAVGRSYCYRLADRSADFDPLARINVWWQPGLDLDLEAMSLAAEVMLGEHDFLSFCRPREGATTIRTLRALKIGRESNGTIEFRPEADAFCHSMVRSLVGALVTVGRGSRSRQWMDSLVRLPSRQHGTPVVPARGLTLESVQYPAPEFWGTRAKEARSMRAAPQECCEGES